MTNADFQTQYALYRLVPSLYVSADCPLCNCAERLVCIVAHLNDWHRMSREYIADWLDTTDMDLTVQVTVGSTR